MAASLLWNIFYTKNQTLAKADVMARLAFEKDTTFRDTVTLEGHTITITTSIGISLYPDHGSDIDTILKTADSAMYQAKQEGRDRCRLYNKD